MQLAKSGLAVGRQADVTPQDVDRLVMRAEIAGRLGQPLDRHVPIQAKPISRQGLAVT